MLGEFGGDQSFCNKIIYLSESRVDFEENLLDLSFDWISPAVVLSFAMRMKDKKATFLSIFSYLLKTLEIKTRQDGPRFKIISENSSIININ